MAFELELRQVAWSNIEPVLIPLQLVFAMLGMGCTLAPRDFLTVVKNPFGALLGLFLQLVFVPLVAVLFIHTLGLSKGWAVGLLLVAAVPGGAFSNLLTFLGRGNVPLSIAITTISTLFCVLTAPTILRLTAAQYLSSEFSFPAARIIRDIFSFLLMPLALGMVIRRLRPAQSDAASRWSIRLSVFLIGVITVAALGTGKIRVIEYGWAPPLTIVGFGAVIALSTPQLSRLLGRYDDDTVALSLEVIVRNVGVGLLLIRFFFPGEPAQGHVLYTSLFYAGITPWFAIPTLLRHRYGKSAVLFRRPLPRPAPPT